VTIVAHNGVRIIESSSPFDQLQTLHAAENIEIALLAQLCYNRFPVSEEPFRVNAMAVIFNVETNRINRLDHAIVQIPRKALALLNRGLQSLFA
jgi:hypothetical protein